MSKQIPLRSLLNPVHNAALGFGSGLLTPAPGTWGTLMGLVVFLLLVQIVGQPPFHWHIVVVVITGIIGVYLCGKTAKELKVYDHPAIVWDEFVGMWMTLIAVPLQWHWLLAAFVLFRFFDIVKPWPINWIDSKVESGLGIMLDDIIAALYAMIVLQLLLYFYT